MEKRVPRCTGQPAATATTAQLRMAPCCPRLPVLINAQCETSGLRGTPKAEGHAPGGIPLPQSQEGGEGPLQEPGIRPRT